jgi:PST family polysaccharide transporter
LTLIVAGFVSAADYGILSVVFLAVAITVAIKTAAVGDKYIQQDEPDQELAFQKAFTLELIFAGLMTAAMAAAAPLLSLAYGNWRLLAPALVISLLIPARALQSPTWIYYRRMDFFRQRLMLAIDPIVTFLVTVGLAIAGLGYWSLVLGFIAGSYAAGIVAMVASPYRPRWVYDHGTMKEYASFSLPVMLTAASGLLLAQVSLLAGNAALGIAAAGVIALAGNFVAYTDNVDRIVTATIYPAICRVRDRGELLLEAFVKSNRLTLMWGMPFGVAVSLFGADLVHFVLGERWNDAILLLQVLGITSAVNHIGFNWDAFYRATGNTRPLAIVGFGAAAAFCLIAIPLLFLDDLEGFAIGMCAVAVVSLSLRTFFVVRLFPGFDVTSYVVRALTPTLPAAGAVLLARLVESGERTPGLAIAELAGYVAITVGATLLAERALLREVLGYLRGHGEPGFAALGR